MPTRIRSTDSLSYAAASVVQTNPSAVTQWYHPTKHIGIKKTVVDVVGHTVDYRYFMIPTYKTRVSKYKGKNPKKALSRTYLTHVNLRRPKRIKTALDTFVRLNDFGIGSFRGYCTQGVLKTPPLPAGWTTYRVTGELASFAYLAMDEEYLVGFDQRDLSRELDQDNKYAAAVLQRAWGKVSAPDVDFVEIIGELSQLINLCKSPFKAFADLSRKFQQVYNADAWVFVPRKGIMSFRTRRKVGRVKLTKDALSAASNRWLEYRYGLMPLILDTEEILKKFREKISYLTQIRMQKSKIVSDSRIIVNERTITLFDNFPCVIRTTTKIRDTYTAKVYYKYKYTIASESVDLGLNKVTLPQSLWELTPWSFVVDWFLGVGDWIRSFNQDPGVTILGNYVTRKRDVWTKYEFVKANYYSSAYPTDVPQSRLYTHSARMKRITNFPMPALPVFNPDFLRWRRVLDSFSLLWGKNPYLKS